MSSVRMLVRIISSSSTSTTMRPARVSAMISATGLRAALSLFMARF
jgi:hypothetical protein